MACSTCVCVSPEFKRFTYGVGSGVGITPLKYSPKGLISRVRAFAGVLTHVQSLHRRMLGIPQDCYF
jgi:hypothetical protein